MDWDALYQSIQHNNLRVIYCTIKNKEVVIFQNFKAKVYVTSDFNKFLSVQ